MKKIKSVQIWDNGKIIEATQLQLKAISVQLENSAMFYYGLYSENNNILREGNIFMEGKDYQDWQNDQYAWDWAAIKLNLEILPEIIEENKVIL
jgi:hypothetical protein